MTITIVDYGMGNLGSIANIIKKVGHSSVISSDAEVIKNAKKLILPGVGAFDKAMKNLQQLKLIDPLNETALAKKTPILGICLGMQLLTRYSEEGNVKGLGWIEADTLKFKFDEKNKTLKIPHMGWNNININQTHPLFEDMYEDPRYYFVHSYHAKCDHQENILTTTYHGYEFDSGIVNRNIIGVQFHPEKSHKFGIKLIKNFIEKC